MLERISALIFAALLTAALALPAPAQLLPPGGEQCFFPPQPIPPGNTGRPQDAVTSEADYQWVHSSTHLQGRPATEKWAWGFYEPAAGSPVPALAGFRTVVVIDNPSPTSAIVVDVEYRNRDGVLLATHTATIDPEGFWSEPASALAAGAGNGLGTIRVVSQPGSGPFVAATVHHSLFFDGVLDDEPLAPDDAKSPGLASMQQFQEVANGATLVMGGPYPTVSDGSATHAALAGLLPLFQLINPNNAVNTVDIYVRGALTGTAFTLSVVLQPFGSHVETTFFDYFYLATSAYRPGFNDDWLVLARSREGLPLLGEQLALDFYDLDLIPFNRFRMASSMMATSTSALLVNPEMTRHDTFGPRVHTVSMIANFTAEDIGPVVIEYRDPRHQVMATDVIDPFPAFRTQRIAPGEPGIVNYPADAWNGTLRILACQPGLAGWTMREVEDFDGPVEQFRKLYGESLDGSNKTEPGNGFPVHTRSADYVRKVMPLSRCANPADDPPFWPSYTAFANLGGTASVGNYFFRFFQADGSEVTAFAKQPFVGVDWGDVSFTYEDGTYRTCRPPAVSLTSGRVDHREGTIVGIDVIGDPLYEWDLGLPSPP